MKYANAGDHSKEFLNHLDSLGQSNPTARDKCLSDSTTCAAAIADVIQGSQSLQVKRKIAARNLRAMKRLGQWTQYNRRKWTDLTQRFNRLFILFSPGPIASTEVPNPERERWQERLMLLGTIESKEALASTQTGGLRTIGVCVDSPSTTELECELTPVPGNSQNQYPTGFRTRLVGGHYHHVHLDLRQ